MKLKIHENYVNNGRALVFAEGTTVEVEEELGEWLLRDSPSCFEEVKEEVKAVSKPAANKMVETPGESK